MARILTTVGILAALQGLAVEVPEGTVNTSDILSEELAKYDISPSILSEEATLFGLGFYRGQRGGSISKSEVPLMEDSAELTEGDALYAAMKEGFGFGLESRDNAISPPANVVYEAFKAGQLEAGSFGEWAAKLQLADRPELRRLTAALQIGAGSAAKTIPAGTPVQVLKTIEKDGQQAAIVLYDGVPVIVPNPATAPVLGDITVAAKAGKKKAPKTPKASKQPTGATDGQSTEKPPKEPKAPKEPRVKGPSLKGCLIAVIEGVPGALATDEQFRDAVVAEAQRQGLTDLGKFEQEYKRHVPYYISCYGPAGGKYKGEIGRMGVEQPLASAVARIKARSMFNRLTGNTYEEKFAALPADIQAACQPSDTRITGLASSTQGPKKNADAKAGGNTAGSADNADNADNANGADDNTNGADDNTAA